MHGEVESPKTLAAFGRPPDHRETGMGDKPLHKVTTVCAELDIVEGHKLDARVNRLTVSLEV
jgi:hypothetical protein